MSWVSESDAVNVDQLEISAMVMQFNGDNKDDTIFDYKKQVVSVLSFEHITHCSP